MPTHRNEKGRLQIGDLIIAGAATAAGWGLFTFIAGLFKREKKEEIDADDELDALLLMGEDD